MCTISAIDYNSSNRVMQKGVYNTLTDHATRLAHEIGISVENFNYIKSNTNEASLEGIMEILYMHYVHNLVNLETRNRYIDRLFKEYNPTRVMKDFLEEYGVEFSKSNKFKIHRSTVLQAFNQGYKLPYFRSIYKNPKTRTSKKPTKIINTLNITTKNYLESAKESASTHGEEYTALVYLYKALNSRLKIEDFPSFENVKCTKEIYNNVLQEITILVNEIYDFYEENEYLPKILSYRLDKYLEDMENLFY